MLNKIILMGRLVADPDYRQTPQGVAVCRFTIAVDRNFVSKNSGERQADFIRIVAWRGSADFVSRYFSKGKPIVVEGSLRNADYTDQNGVKHYAMEVQADNIGFTISDNSNNNGGGNYSNNNYQQGSYGNNGGYAPQGNNGYNQGGYAPQGNNNSYYQQTPQPAPPVYQQPVNNAPVEQTASAPVQQNNDNLQIGNLDDFEEILSDGEIPF